MADSPKYCCKCNVLLDDSNSYASHRVHAIYICKPCALARSYESKTKHLKQDPVLYRCKGLLIAARSRAKKYNREFSLTLDHLLELAKQTSCPISQRPFVWRTFIGSSKNKCHPDAPSLDRIDSSRGYTPDNVWLISYRMNTIKSDATPEELKLVSNAVFLKIMENYLDSL